MSARTIQPNTFVTLDNTLKDEKGTMLDQSEPLFLSVCMISGLIGLSWLQFSLDPWAVAHMPPHDQLIRGPSPQIV